MIDLSKQKIILRLAILLMLIGILLANIPNLINPTFFLWLESTIGYKLLWNLFLLTTLVLLYLLSSKKLYFLHKDTLSSNSNNELRADDRRLTKDREKTMRNLSPAEASILILFLEGNTKVINIKYDATVKNLARNEVLQCLLYNQFSLIQEITIHEWAWVWLKKNRKIINAIISL